MSIEHVKAFPAAQEKPERPGPVVTDADRWAKDRDQPLKVTLSSSANMSSTQNLTLAEATSLRDQLNDRLGAPGARATVSSDEDTIEAQVILILDGKVVVQDIQTIAKGCYSLDITLNPKDCCTEPAPATGGLTRGDGPAFA